MHIMVCSACLQQNIAQKGKLKSDDLAIKIKCSSCNKKSVSNIWKCNCGVMWHTCPRHGHTQDPPYEAGGNLTTVARKASKRQLLTANLEQILDDDLMRESKQAKKCPREDFIELGHTSPHNRVISIGMIPQVLRERFHLASSPRHI